MTKNILLSILTICLIVLGLQSFTRHQEAKQDKYTDYTEVYNKSGVVILKNKEALQGCGATGKKTSSLAAPTSYSRIRSYNERLKALADPSQCGYIPWDLENFPSIIKMTTNNPGAELGRLIKNGGGTLYAVFGVDDRDRFTVSFLVAKKDRVDPRHIQGTSEARRYGVLSGEETWPDGSTTFIGDAPQGSARIELPSPRVPN
jgi:hypothetical protein